VRQVEQPAGEEAQPIGVSSRQRGRFCVRSDRGGELLPPEPVRHCRQRFAAACPSSSRQQLLPWHDRRSHSAVPRVPLRQAGNMRDIFRETFLGFIRVHLLHHAAKERFFGTEMIA
jgi:hypothetical protein